jgi:nucleotide-binding universal stress UspA family protein
MPERSPARAAGQASASVGVGAASLCFPMRERLLGPSAREAAMRILLAIDGSPASRAAVHALDARPWPMPTQVRLLSVVQYLYAPDTPLVPEAGLMGEGLESVYRQLELNAHALLNPLASHLRECGFAVETVVRLGDPRVEICEEARRWGAELIVVGSHGRTGLRRFLMGSVAQSVVRHAPCSVEVVRAPPETLAAHAAEGASAP